MQAELKVELHSSAIDTNFEALDPKLEAMKEAIVSPDLSVKIIDSPVPKPGPGEVLIKVICAGFNPKDWKYPFFTKQPGNTGDDVAGEVAEVGEDVFEFKHGDKVAAFHEMTTSGGAFAEYAIAHASTTFHLPKKTSFEEVCVQMTSCRRY